MEELIQFLNVVRPMSKKLENHLRSIVRRRVYKQGKFLLQLGRVSKHILYIRKGLIRSYSTIRGGEVSEWFMKEGDIAISILSFFRQAPAEDVIVALEDCECWGITYQQLQRTYKLFPEFNYHGRMITMQYYIRSELRNKAVKRQSPEDKYAQLMETDPDLLRRVQNKDLASFLNVSERTFYRIRKDYASPKKNLR